MAAEEEKPSKVFPEPVLLKVRVKEAADETVVDTSDPEAALLSWDGPEVAALPPPTPVPEGEAEEGSEELPPSLDNPPCELMVVQEPLNA